MSQNVDENEEYELIDKERKPTCSLISNLDQIVVSEQNEIDKKASNKRKTLEIDDLKVGKLVSTLNLNNSGKKIN